MDAITHRVRRRDWWCLLPALALFLATVGLSLGTTPDSLRYLAAAEALRTTGKLGADFTLWPPLYPALLALHPLDIRTWAAILAKAGELATLLGVWAIGRGLLQSRYALAFGLLALVALPHFSLVFTHVWSETVYLPLIVWTTWFWTRHLHDGSLADALIAAAILSLAMLTRHVGVVLAIAMALTALAYRRPLRWIALACLPYGAWVARTYFVSGTYAGSRAPLAEPNLAWQLEQFGRVLAHWLAPHFFPTSGGMAVALLVLAALGVAAIRFLRDDARTLLFLALFVLGHSVLTIWTASRIVLDVDARTLMPVSWALMLIGLWGVDRLCRRVEETNRARWVQLALALYGLFWFSAPNEIVNALI
jgi:hypothetical protein